MDHFAMKHNSFAACEEMRGVASIPVVCPKPRRVGQLSGSDPFRSIRWQASHHSDLCDKASVELLDIFLKKGGEAATSPPFFSGSPPARSDNPLIHDPQFGEEKPDPILTAGSPLSPHQIFGYARTNYGFKPAQVRVVGFECRRGTHSISAMA